jgi:hypothetical protein
VLDFDLNRTLSVAEKRSDWDLFGRSSAALSVAEK